MPLPSVVYYNESGTYETHTLSDQFGLKVVSQNGDDSDSSSIHSDFSGIGSKGFIWDVEEKRKKKKQKKAKSKSNQNKSQAQKGSDFSTNKPSVGNSSGLTKKSTSAMANNFKALDVKVYYQKLVDDGARDVDLSTDSGTMEGNHGPKAEEPIASAQVENDGGERISDDEQSGDSNPNLDNDWDFPSSVEEDEKHDSEDEFSDYSELIRADSISNPDEWLPQLERVGDTSDFCWKEPNSVKKVPQNASATFYDTQRSPPTSTSSFSIVNQHIGDYSSLSLPKRYDFAHDNTEPSADVKDQQFQQQCLKKVTPYRAKVVKKMMKFDYAFDNLPEVDPLDVVFGHFYFTLPSGTHIPQRCQVFEFDDDTETYNVFMNDQGKFSKVTVDDLRDIPEKTADLLGPPTMLCTIIPKCDCTKCIAMTRDSKNFSLIRLSFKLIFLFSLIACCVFSMCFCLANHLILI